MEWRITKYLVNGYFLIMLSYFSYRDIRERTLHSRALQGGVGISLLLSVLCTVLSPFPSVYGVSVIISAVFGIGFAFFAKKAQLLKAGDREGILCYAILSPFLIYPLFPYSHLLFSPVPLFIFDLMINLVFFLILIPLFTGIYNFVNYIRQKNAYRTLSNYPWYPLILFIGIPSRIEALQKKDPNKYIVLEEKLLDGWHLTFHFKLDHRQTATNKEIINSANNIGKQFLFIQPTLPMYLFLLSSILLFIFFGNIGLSLFHILNFVLLESSLFLEFVLGAGIILVLIAGILLLQTFKKK